MPNGKKHFNLGNAFGVVISAKANKVYETFCADIVMDCHSAVHGNPRAYGRIWGQRGQEFLAWYKRLKPQDQVIKVEGFYSQFTKEGGETYSNYVVFKWEARQDEVPRAGFVLTGELKRIYEDGGEKVVLLHLSRAKDKEASGFTEEDFKLYLHPKDAKKLKGVDMDGAVGRVVSLKGLLCQMGELDYISDKREGEVRPYIKEVVVHAG